MGYSKQSKIESCITEKGYAGISDYHDPEGGICVRTSRAPSVEIAMAGASMFVSKEQALAFFKDAVDVINAQIAFDAWLEDKVVGGMHAFAEQKRSGRS